ncbi:histone-lysine N-methyltransferase SETMAR [Trichonephila clavipes]|nr:histone-lysine N-methyltransferase SETMAR [Trichonephila clavipes]
MVTVWQSSAGLIHHSFIKSGEKVTWAKYCNKIDEMHITTLIKSCTHWATKLYRPSTPFIRPLTYELSLFKHLDNFLQVNCFRNLKNAETAFNKFVAFRAAEFYDTGIKKLVTYWQK